MALNCIEAFVTLRKGRAGEAANFPADGVMEVNQTAASFRHAAIGGVSVACTMGHPKRSDPINTAFVFLRHQKPKLGRALQKRRVHAEHQKPKRLGHMGERSCRTVAPLSEAASRGIIRGVAGYLPQYFTCARSFIGMRRPSTEVEQHLAGMTYATPRDV
ncbi:unnamed protein product [Trypanosoma congolense IL3000]|uniref:WGS project CAEQ00000000 data, annotated contig 890 n=1 Tax=Trypanosoma congolense (strain IL3000) TaxID=1068625 RepID=F9WJ98_TRYCI|nr:unnamed protein product [Trypanosoma congolense IL3000]